MRDCGSMGLNVSNCGDWDLADAAEQTECLSSYWRVPPCTDIHIYMLTSSPPSISARAGSRMGLLELYVSVWVLRVSLCSLHGWLSMHVHMHV